MKKYVSIAVVAVIAAVAVAAFAEAGPGRFGKGSGGWGCRSEYNRMFDAQSLVTITGTIAEVDTFTPRRGMHHGVHLKVNTGAETVSVHLGPSWYLERQDITLEKGDSIIVKGSKIPFGDEPAIIAAEVTKGDTVLTLRDESGIPLWAGARMRR